MSRKRKVPEPDADGMLRTGIYVQRVASETISTAESRRRLDGCVERWKNPRSIHSWLKECIECCAEMIRPHLDNSGSESYLLELGEGWHMYPIADTIPDSVEARQVHDAIECMVELRVLSHNIGDDDNLTGDIGYAIHAAFRLGCISERLGIRIVEPLVRTLLERRDARKAAAATTNAAHVELWSKYQDEVDRRIADGLSYAKACEDVSREEGVSARTVKNHTTNPSLRSSGKRHAK